MAFIKVKSSIRFLHLISMIQSTINGISIEINNIIEVPIALKIGLTPVTTYHCLHLENDGDFKFSASK